MKKGTVIWLVIAAVLILAGGILFSLVLSEYSWDFSKLEQSEFVTETVPVTGTFRNIKIKADRDNIAILPSEDGHCSVTFHEAEKVLRSASVENGTLRIETEDTRSWYEKLLSFSSKKAKITLYLPGKEYGSLAVEASTGDIGIPENYTFEEISAAASTGDIFCGADVRGALTLSVSTGDIELRNVSAGDITLSLTTGHAKLSGGSCASLSVAQSTGRLSIDAFTCRDLSAAASTGDVRLENVSAEKDITIGRTTGDIDLLRCDANNLSLKTTTGNITASLRTEKVFLTETDTGKIDVPRTVSGGRCDLKTSTGDISVRIE